MTLFVYNSYVAPRKDALKACPRIESFGPVGIHKLCDEDTVVGKNSQVASIRRMVFVEC